MREIRCPYCDNKLFEAKNGIVRIKCVRNTSKRRGCGRIIEFEISDKSVKHTVVRE